MAYGSLYKVPAALQAHAVRPMNPVTGAQFHEIASQMSFCKSFNMGSVFLHSGFDFHSYPFWLWRSLLYTLAVFLHIAFGLNFKNDHIFYNINMAYRKMYYAPLEEHGNNGSQKHSLHFSGKSLLRIIKHFIFQQF